jgi:hypothetical protein
MKLAEQETIRVVKYQDEPTCLATKYLALNSKFSADCAYASNFCKSNSNFTEAMNT